MTLIHNKLAEAGCIRSGAMAGGRIQHTRIYDPDGGVDIMPCLGSETNQANCSREALGGGGGLSEGVGISALALSLRTVVADSLPRCCTSVSCQSCSTCALRLLSVLSVFTPLQTVGFQFSVFSFRFCQFSFSRNGMLS